MPHASRNELPVERIDAYEGRMTQMGDYNPYADGSEEVFRAGDAYYAGPGHLPTVLEDVDLVEFSPKAQFDELLAQIQSNLEAAEAAS